MRVLHVIPAVAARYGGPSAALAPMCRALAAAGVDTHIASTDADGSGRLQVPLGTDTTWDGVPATFFKRDATESFKYSRGLAQWLDAHVGEFDVVHIHAVLSHAPLAAASACRRANVPYVVRPLGTIASWSLGRKSWKKQILLALGARRLLQDAALLHCTSTEEWDDARTTFGLTRGAVIPLGIDPSLADLPAEIAEARASDRYVLALSRLHPKKNFGLLIDAFLDAHDEAHAPWRLVIAGAGDDEYEAQLREQVRKAGAKELVRFAGWVQGAEKRALLQGASIFALPSMHENFGIAVLEALTAGVPAMISKDVQLAADLAAADAGWVVDSTHEALSATLHSAMTEERVRADKGHAAARMARQYAWPAIASRLAAMYTDIVRAKTHASH